MQDLRIDLGAYRFDTNAMPLVNHVMKEVLDYPLRCYDPPNCNAYGNLVSVEDAYGNNRGYASGSRVWQQSSKTPVGGSSLPIVCPRSRSRR
jgi:hypothetical protein